MASTTISFDDVFLPSKRFSLRTRRCETLPLLGNKMDEEPIWSPNHSILQLRQSICGTMKKCFIGNLDRFFFNVSVEQSTNLTRLQKIELLSLFIFQISEPR